MAMRLALSAVSRGRVRNIQLRSFSTLKEPTEMEYEKTRSTKYLLKENKSGAQSNTQAIGFAASGTVLCGSGGAMLVLEHMDWLTTNMFDIGGTALLVCGSALLARAFSLSTQASSSENTTRIVSSPKGEEYEIELIPLNDELRYGQARKALEASLVGLSGNDEHSVEKILKDADKIANETNEKEQKDARRKLFESVKEQLKTESARRVRQKLRPRVFVIEFDTRASPRRGGLPAEIPSTRALLDDLREQVNLLLGMCSPYDEVILKITSPGGAVTDYGLAAAHFARLKDAGIRSTACVDLVAASGGFMIACAASKVIASQFAIVGSIGVVAQAPNVYKLLDNNGVEVIQRTAGEYKRTVQTFQPNTEEGLRKFDEELALIHSAFIAHVSSHRAALIADPKKVFTGESWLALHALDLGLVDQLMTSDEYIRTRQIEADTFCIRRARPKRQPGLSSFLSHFTEAYHSKMPFSFFSSSQKDSWWHWFSQQRPPSTNDSLSQEILGDEGIKGRLLHSSYQSSAQIKARDFGGSALEADAARMNNQ